MEQNVESHPLRPFLPVNARILMLGSFPPQQKRWCMNFFYPNWNNDMWRIFGLVFFNDKDHFVEKENKSFDRESIIEFLNDKGIALYDTARVVRRINNNASDKFLEIIEPTDIIGLLRQIPDCSAIAVTGEKACATLASKLNCVQPRTGQKAEVDVDGRHLRLYRMPSSSRAYPLGINKKAEAYAKMFREIFDRNIIALP